MGLFDKLTKGFKGMFGLDRSGGTRDAFSSYQDYVKFLDPRIEAERSRLFNRGQNPYLGRLLEPYAGLDRDANAIEQRAGNIGALLQGSALRSTTGSQIAAVRAAREAAGGRAGLGFGGAAGALAARAASDAAVQQNAAMSEALLQGEQIGLNAQSQAASLRQALAAARGQSLMAEANLFESRFGQEADFSRQLLALLGGLSGGALGQGLAGQQASAGRRVGLMGVASGIAGGL